MRSTFKCIYSYYETLLGIWNIWNDGILYGRFPDGANSFTEALGINTSDGRSRAKEIYRIGLLKQELTKGTSGLDYIAKGNNIQSDLGYISAILSKAATIKRTYNIDKSLSAICAIYAIIQSVKIDDVEFSINTLIQKLNEAYPCPEDIDFRKWHRYTLSAFFCETKYREESHLLQQEQEDDSKEFLNFFLGKSICPSMTIRMNEKKGYTARKVINSSKDVSDAIANKVSLTDIIQQKSPLFVFGDEKDVNPKGFYGMALKHNANFLRLCYELEKCNIKESPFIEFYDEESQDSTKGDVLKKLPKIFENRNEIINKEFQKLMKSIYDGTVDALGILNFTPKRTPVTHKERTTLPYLTAIRTKPFLLLAGISGTGKSRIVRKLAQATVTEELQKIYNPQSVERGFNRFNLHKPANFELVQVKPNWHNSLEVVGYKSNIGGAHYEFSPFVEFVARAWRHQEIPFFLCLDEMNLAPVEQYFAEFLSAIESRSIENDEYETDPIIKPFKEFDTKDADGEVIDKLSDRMIAHLIGALDTQRKTDLAERFRNKGLTLPKNLIVLGTVNMDETTFSFSRKVLDRAMSIVMNDVSYKDFFEGTTEKDLTEFDEATKKLLVDRDIEGLNAAFDNGKDDVHAYLQAINDKLEGTPFKLGYRAANEALLYVSASNAFSNNEADVNAALDEFTMMKILSRIEGDKRSVGTLLPDLQDIITEAYPKSNKKLKDMAKTLTAKQFVSYWT